MGFFSFFLDRYWIVWSIASAGVMGLVWYWKNSVLYSIARAGLTSLPKTYFFAPISCYHKMWSGFICCSKRQKDMLENMRKVRWYGKYLSLNWKVCRAIIVVLCRDSTSISSSANNAEKSFFQKKDVYLMVYHLQHMLYNCISIWQFTKLHIVGHNHYAKFPHGQIHVNGAGNGR